MKKFISNSDNETKKIAANLAKHITSGVVSLNGELGAGKTTFVQGFAKGLGIKEKIISPTFVLIKQHKIPNNKNVFFHIDLYRLENPEEFILVGIKELLDNPENLVLIEWGEKIKKYLPENTISIAIDKLKTNKRNIIISNL